MNAANKVILTYNMSIEECHDKLNELIKQRYEDILARYPKAAEFTKCMIDKWNDGLVLWSDLIGVIDHKAPWKRWYIRDQNNGDTAEYRVFDKIKCGKILKYIERHGLAGLVQFVEEMWPKVPSLIRQVAETRKEATTNVLKNIPIPIRDIIFEEMF